MTVFVPAYDVEHPDAQLETCRKITQIHQDYGIPATFFIVGRLLETNANAYREVFDKPGLFEIASHTYSHKMLRDHPICGPAISAQGIHTEIFRGKELIEEVFGRECLGLRPACSFDVGLRGAPSVLSEVAAAGYRYVSSHAWGPDYTMPAPLEQAHTYADEGYPELWELPCHGWHENLLKADNATPPLRLLLWPPLYPEIQLSGYVKTPEEEFMVHRFFIDQALEENLEYVSLIWHPWSLGRFDPEMRMLELVFEYIVKQGMRCVRFEDLRPEKAGTSE